MFYIVLFACLQVVTISTLIQKEAILNAHTPSQDGASIYYNNETVTPSSSTYKIFVSAQEQYDVLLSLDKSWSFKPSISSSISLTLDGNTPSPERDTDLLLVFSVNDWQYFTFFTHLDYINNIKSRIYPSISIQNISRSVSDWISDPTYYRWERVSNNDKWISLNFKKQSIWPLRFIITNDAINDKTYFEFYHNSSSIAAIQYTINTAFVCDEDIDIYIMGDSLNEKFTISSFNIQLLHETITTSPTIDTYNPSISSTHYPSIIPTITPTHYPSITPTYNPTTLFPTTVPSIAPSTSTMIQTTSIITSSLYNVIDTDTTASDAIYLSAEEEAITTEISDGNNINVYTTGLYTFIDAMYPSNSSFWRYAFIVVTVMSCGIVIICVCVIRMCCSRSHNVYVKKTKSQSIMTRIERSDRYSRSFDDHEGKQTPSSTSSDTIVLDLMDGINQHILEEEEEAQETVDVQADGEQMLDVDEFIVRGDSIDGANGGLWMDDGINGEYDEEGNVYSENDVENVVVNGERNEEHRTADADTLLNLAEDEFVVMSDNEQLTLRK